MDMQRKWINLLKEIAEASTEELRSCPSELVEEVQNKLRNTISWPDDEPTASQIPTVAQATDTKHDLLQNVLQKSKEISKFLELDLQEIFQTGVQQQGVDPRIRDIAKFAEKTKFDRLRCIFGCWTLFLDNKEWTRGKTSHESSVKNFTKVLGAPSRNVVTYGLSRGAKIHAYIEAFKGLAIMPLLPFIGWKQLDDHEMSAFAELCHGDKNIEEFLKAGAQAYAESEKIFRMSLQRRESGVQAAKRTGPDVSEHRHGKSQRVSSSSSFLPNSSNSTAPAALQYLPPSPHFANGSNTTLNMYAATPIDAWNGETSTFSALDEYLSNSTAPIDGSLSWYPTVPIDGSLSGYPTAPIDGSLSGYPTAPIDSFLSGYQREPIDGSLRVYSSEQLETPEQSLDFNHSLFSMAHPQNIPITNLA
jgi:hypothetical protein